jgi:hypothetical protein
MLRLSFRILGIILVFAFLTVLTQVGGVVYLIALIANRLWKERIGNRIFRVLSLPASFIVLYLTSTAFIVPLLARKFGREPLPWRGTLRPLNTMTCLLNRHYVGSPLKNLARDAAAQMAQAYPGTVVNYLDANFPFYNGFPLVPHLSHNDGRKLDIALFYTDAAGKALNDAPSSIGYGVFVDPRPGDENYLEICERKGYWQYGAMAKIISQDRKPEYSFDHKRQKAFIKLLTDDQRLQILLIEPHLKARMKLTSPKIRFHGCHAVRHDDHIHIQIR